MGIRRIFVDSLNTFNTVGERWSYVKGDETHKLRKIVMKTAVMRNERRKSLNFISK